MSDSIRPKLKVSREGVVLIKSFEGFRPRAVRGDDGGWTIGYGHTASAREGLTVGEQDAELLLQYDLLPVVKALNEQIAAPLNQHQFDALASFALSVGLERFLKSDVLDRINAGHAGQAADALIGWPEAATPTPAARRRAAERALFVADPSGPVALADLLAAPLPPPPVAVEPAPEADPATVAADARAAAVASLLGEPEPEPEAAPAEPTAEEPAPIVPEPAREAGEPEPVDEPAPAPVAQPVVAPAPVFAAQLQRYSPYSTAALGPLPGFPVAAPAPVEVKPPAEQVVEPEPAVTLPHFGTADIAAPEPIWAPAQQVPVAQPAPIVPDFSPAPAMETTPFAPTVQSSAFPPLPEPLVLTPPTEADFDQAARAVWPAEDRLEVAADEEPLFEGEPALSVLRHEVEPTEPRRFDWGETGMYLVMGGLGLASCAFSAAAFRLSAVQPSPMGETTVVAWALALIGVICVGVSSWNLYVRWGRSQ